MAKKMVFGRYDYAAFSCFIAYACCSLVVPVCLVQLAQSLGFPLGEGGKGAGGALQLGRSIPMVAAMLFCGFAAGRWGKVRSLGVAMVLMSVGIGLAAIAPAYGLLFAAVAVAGLGEGVVEGLATPVIQDLHIDDEPGRYINFSHSFWSVGVVGTVMLAGLLLYCGVSWRFVLAGACVISLVPAFLFLLPYHGPQKPDRQEQLHWTTVSGHALELVKTPRFWLFFAAMFLAGGGEFCLTFWVSSFIQLDYSASALMGGLGTAFFAGGMIVGRMVSGFLVSQEKLRHLVVGCAVAGTLLGLFPPLLSADMIWILFGLLFFLGIATGPFWPSIQSYCVDRVKGDSTMIFILLSCAGVPGCGFFAWLMGVVGDRWGLRDSFFLVPACYAGLGLLIAYDWCVLRRERQRK
ncbi:MFS transporter [Victivallis vadensis]|jgi:MFS transporter|uniref:MFS transporter n=2 Tax=Victivallis vadensis TaxID=172901 RepID=UPI00259248FE|nr:MFS transporter [uncultured Victivallis sp.]